MMEYNETRILDRVEYMRANVNGADTRCFIRIPEEIQAEWMKCALETGNAHAVDVVIREIERLAEATQAEDSRAYAKGRHILVFGRGFAHVGDTVPDDDIEILHAYGISRRVWKRKRGGWRQVITIKRFQ